MPRDLIGPLTSPTLQKFSDGGGGGGGDSDPSGSSPATDGPVPGLGTKGAPVSETDRLAALDAIEAECQRQVGSGTTFDPASMVDILKQRSVFHEVGYTAASSCAWAAFTDGRKLLIVNNVDISAPLEKRAFLSSMASPEPLHKASARAAAAVNYDDPIIVVDQFRLMNMWPGLPVMNVRHITEGWVDKDSINRIGRIAKGLGFSLVDLGPNSQLYAKVCDVEGLREVSDDGVFFITGAGGFMETSGGTLQGICTLTPAKTAGSLNKDHEADLDNGRLFYALAPFWTEEGHLVSRSCLAITPEFARYYKWSFPDESLVFLNVTGSGLAGWLDLLQSAGAGLIFGWTGSPHARTMLGAAQDFFELVLATNHVSSSWPGLTTEPRMRPYGMEELYSYLMQQGLFTGADAGGGAGQVERFYGNSGAFVDQLRPSIEYLLIDEIHQQMQIQGKFGKTVGHVRIGGETQRPSESELSEVGDPPLTSFGEMRILNWRAHNIKVDLAPANAPRETGMVQVWLGGRYSNVAHLTRWRVTFHINRTVAGSLHRSADIDVVIRAFVSGYRLRPDRPIDEQWRFSAVTNRKEGKVGYSASGSLSKTEHGTTITVTWSGAGNFVVSSPPAETFSLLGVFVIPERRLDCTLAMSRQKGLRVKTETKNERGTTTDEQTAEFDLSTPEFRPRPPVSFGPLSLSFDRNWALNAGSLTFSDALESVLGYDHCETTIRWESAYPDFPPEKDRGGR